MSKTKNCANTLYSSRPPALFLTYDNCVDPPYCNNPFAHVLRRHRLTVASESRGSAEPRAILTIEPSITFNRGDGSWQTRNKAAAPTSSRSSQAVRAISQTIGNVPVKPVRKAASILTAVAQARRASLGQAVRNKVQCKVTMTTSQMGLANRAAAPRIGANAGFAPMSRRTVRRLSSATSRAPRRLG
jgi:hypothetical protein